MPAHWLLNIFGVNVSLIMFTAFCKYAFLVFMNVVLVFVMVRVLRVLHANIGNKAYYMYLMYICAMNVYVVGFEYRYTDYILFMLQVAGVYFAIKRKEFLALITMIVSLFVHEGSLLLSCPIVFIIIIAVHLHDDAKSKTKAYIKMVLMGMILMLISMYFLKFQGYFYDESTIDKIHMDMLTDLGYPINEDTINRINVDCKLTRQIILCVGTTKWNASLTPSGEYDYASMFISHLTTLFYAITLLPIVICIAKRLIRNLKRTKSIFIKLEKLLIMTTGVIAMLPMIIFKEDIARWITFIWVYYAFLGFYGLYTNSEVVIGALDDMANKVKNLLAVSKTNIAPVLVYAVSILPFGGGAINYVYLIICFEVVAPTMTKYFPGVLSKAVEIMQMINGG